MSTRLLILLATLGSLALLAGAFAFQHLGGLQPCPLCLTQRWPHAAAVLVGAVILGTGAYRFAPLGAIAALTTAGYGAYHVGVEQKWWAGPGTCSGGTDRTGMSAEDILNDLLTAPIVRCDEIPWELAGISMAGWNALASLALVFLWAYASKQSLREG